MKYLFIILSLIPALVTADTVLLNSKGSNMPNGDKDTFLTNIGGTTVGRALFRAADVAAQQAALNINLTSGPVRSANGVSSIADNAIAPSKVNGLTASINDLTAAVTNRMELGGVTAGTNVTITGSGLAAAPYVINAAGGGAWGGITGTLANQSDLSVVLAKADYLPWTLKAFSDNRSASKPLVLRTMVEGDSWTGFDLSNPLIGQFGWFGEIVQAGSGALGGTATITAQHTKYSVGSYSGNTVLLDASGEALTFQKNGGNFLPSNTAVIAYRRQSGGGVFKLEIRDASGGWQLVDGSISTNGSAAIIWSDYNFVALTGYSSIGTQVRATWVSGGPVEIVAGGVTSAVGNDPATTNRQGVVMYNAGFQGSNMAQYDTIPPQAWDSVMSYLKPHIVFIREFREPGVSTSAWLASLNSVTSKMSAGRKSGFTASLIHGSGTSTVTVTSTTSGASGEAKSIKFLKAGNSTPLAVSVSGNEITVNLATDGIGLVTSTAAQVVTAINASGPAAALVTASGSGGGLCGNTIDFIPLSTGVGIDFVLIGSHPVSSDLASFVAETDKITRDWCQQNRVLFVDTRAFFPATFAASSQMGFQSTDQLHLTNSGNKFIERIVGSQLGLWEIAQPYQFNSQAGVPQWYGSGAYNNWWVAYDANDGGSGKGLGFKRLDAGTVNTAPGWNIVPQNKDSSWISEGATERMGGTTFRQIDAGGRQAIGYNTAMTRLVGGSVEIGTESAAKSNLVLTGMTGQTSPIMEVRTGGAYNAFGTVVSGYDKQGVVFSNLPVKANDAAADADTAIPTGGFYRITGSRAVYQKP